uniref:Uncharacterized protein n=1 Tax=Meloidogyne enterolobii TaxID=390850 RepID=A0A6V7UUH3_MELEN|nr:unnamed protein product [Meloidogyne enterolobii]
MNYANNYIVFLKLSENDHNLISQVLPVIVLQQNPDMIEQATMAYLKLLERQRAQKLFNEVYNERRTMIMQQLERGEKIYNRMDVIPAFVKRQPVRRCGTLLIKHIQKVCNGCLRSSTDSNPMVMTKRISAESRNRLKRDAGFSKITDICCTQRACDDEELKPFCC